ncbi:MAG: cytochrome c3 family protein [Acidobacteriota bacterium]
MKRESEEQQTSKRWPFWLLGLTVVSGLMIYTYYFFPVRDIGPRQPIPFSHRVHAGVKDIQCLFCHPFADQAEHAGLPSVDKCFFCHKHVIPLHPYIAKEKEHLEKGVPVPWVQIFYVPDFVKFQHEPHVSWAKKDCTVCHGDVKTYDRLQPVAFQMGFCIDCHRENKAQTDCWLACHH